MPRPKQTEMKTTRKERRRKFDNWIDPHFRRSQWLDGKSKKMPGVFKNYTVSDDWERKRVRIKCSICKEVSGSGIKKADGEWYCFKHESYAGIKNIDRRINNMPQSKNHPDYEWKYQIKWNIKFFFRRIKCVLQSKIQKIGCMVTTQKENLLSK